MSTNSRNRGRLIFSLTMYTRMPTATIQAHSPHVYLKLMPTMIYSNISRSDKKTRGTVKNVRELVRSDTGTIAKKIAELLPIAA